MFCVCTIVYELNNNNNNIGDELSWSERVGYFDIVQAKLRLTRLAGG